VYRLHADNRQQGSLWGYARSSLIHCGRSHSPQLSTRLGGQLTGCGLIGMRERVETLGGTLQAGPRHDAGWTVVATVSIHSGQLA
jgi:hypothetical protein